MKTFTKTLGIAGVVLGLNACNCGDKTDSNSTTATNNESQYETLIAKPLSAKESYSHGYANLSIVVELGEEKILATYGFNAQSAIEPPYNTRIIALIQSEINDGDNEPIKLVGKYRKDAFGNQMFGFNEITVEKYHYKLEDRLE